MQESTFVASKPTQDRVIYYPPHKMYAFEHGWNLTRGMVEYFIGNANNNARKCSQYIGKQFDQASDGGETFIAWVVAIFVVPYIAIQYSVLLFIMSVLVSVHAALLIILMSLSLLLIWLLRSCSWLRRRVYGIYYRCPRAYCYAEMPVPTFICPQCKALHSRLWPSVYGIFRHKCRCGAKLRTMDLWGRKKLVRICPECRAELNAAYGTGTNIDIPIIGGPSAGKTNYIIAATAALIRTYATDPYNYTISFSEPAQRQHFEASLWSLQRGERLAKTPDVAPEAYNLKIKVPSVRVPHLLFFYDAAGEAFSADLSTGLQAYYKYIKGIILIVDPCSIATYRRHHQDEIEPIRSFLGPSELDVEEMCNRMLHSIEMYRMERMAGRYPVPVAVVMTKVDALGLEDEVGASAAQRLRASCSSAMTEGDAINQLVQDFFRKHGLSNFMDQLENRFAEVRYFSCSALGRLPTDTDKSAFVPIRVLDSFTWILRRSGVMKSTTKV